MKKLLNKVSKNIPYLLFLIIVCVCLLIYVWDANPGNVYVGEDVPWAFEGTGITYTNESDSFEGISVWYDLSDELAAKNATRTSLEKIGIAKNLNNTVAAQPDDAVQSGKANNSDTETCRVIAYDSTGDKPLGEWVISVSDIRPDTATMFAMEDAIPDMEGHIVAVGFEYPDTVNPYQFEPLYKKIPASNIEIIYFVAVVILMAFAIIASRKMNYQLYFAITAGILAVLWIIALPFGRVPDENDHFYRAYGISEGVIIAADGSIDAEPATDGAAYAGTVMSVAKGAYLPAGIDMNVPLHTSTFRDIIGNRGIKIDKNDVSWYNFPNMALYSPISYIPQLLGLMVSKLFTDKVMIMAYAGRILIAAFTIIMLAISIKLVPVKKETVFMVGLLPMVFQQGISWSADAFVNVMGIFFACYVLHLAYKDKDDVLSLKEKIILWVSGILIALCKVVYVPIILLMFIISAPKFGGKLKKNIHCFGTLVAGSVLSLIWMTTSNLAGSASGDQINYILDYPLEFIKLIPRTLLTFTTDIFGELLGNNLGGLNIPVYSLPLVLMGIYLLYISIIPEERAFSTGVKWIFALIWMAVVALTFGSMYLGFNSVGNNLIVGFQGRYLIPVILTFLFSFEAVGSQREAKDRRVVIYPMMMAVNLFAIITVLNHTMW